MQLEDHILFSTKPDYLDNISQEDWEHLVSTFLANGTPQLSLRGDNIVIPGSVLVMDGAIALRLNLDDKYSPIIGVIPAPVVISAKGLESLNVSLEPFGGNVNTTYLDRDDTLNEKVYMMMDALVTRTKNDFIARSCKPLNSKDRAIKALQLIVSAFPSTTQSTPVIQRQSFIDALGISDRNGLRVINHLAENGFLDRIGGSNEWKVSRSNFETS